MRYVSRRVLELSCKGDIEPKICQLMCLSVNLMKEKEEKGLVKCVESVNFLKSSTRSVSVEGKVGV